MAANFNFSLGFNVEKEGLNRAKSELDSLRNQIKADPVKFNIEPGNKQEALQQISVFENALKKAFNPNISKLDTKELMSQLHAAGYSLEGLRANFDRMGVDAQQSFSAIDRGLNNTGLSIKKTNQMISGMIDTFTNTLKWNLASQSIHAIEGSISSAIGFTKQLDNSLNNIQIVTGKNKDEMTVFARQANEAAAALGKTTTEYSDASLLFFQQGKNSKEVKDLTQATLIGSNITGESVKDTSELLTAALNGFNLESSKAMEIMDKFAAVGAGTGSDFNELAIGFSKVASMAHTAGVSVDQLNGMLSTVSTVTREAPESIGTSFKTILARMDDLKVGKKDEDGWVIGDAEKALKKVNISLMDAQGHIREMGDVIEEVGGKWNTFTREDKLGVSVALAGTRQQNRLLALFNNWNMYTDAVKMSNEAEGTATEQNLVRMNSIEYKAKQLRAAMEELWMKIINSDEIKAAVDFMTKLTQGASNFISTMGGIQPILIMMLSAFGRLASNKIGTGVADGIDKWNTFKDNRRLTKETPASIYYSQDSSAAEKKAARDAQELVIRKHLTEEEHKAFKASREKLEIEEKNLEVLQKEIAEQNEFLKNDEKWFGSKRARDNEQKSNKKKLTLNENALSAIEDYRSGVGKGKSVQVITPEMREMLGVSAKDLKIARNNGDVEFFEKLNALIAENIQELNERQAAIKRNQDATSADAQVELRAASERALALEDEDGRANRRAAERAQRVGAIETTVNTISAVAMGVTAFSSALKGVEAAGDDFGKKTEAIASGVGGIGATLMMIPHPAAMVTGALMMVGSTIGPLIASSTDLGKAIESNKKILETTANSILEAKNKLKDYADAVKDIKDLHTLLKDGAVNPNDLRGDQLQQYKDLSNMIAEKVPEMVKYYDAEGNAVIDLTKNLDKLKEAQKDQIREQNATKAGNAKGFATEYGDKIKKAQEKIDKDQEVLRAMQSGEEGLKAYNNTQSVVDAQGTVLKNGKTYSMDDMNKLTAEVQEQQATLQEASENIKANIIEPLFAGSKAYQGLTDKQKEMTRGLLTIEKATELAHDPKKLEQYTKEVNKVIDALGKENEQAKKITESKTNNENKIAELKKGGVTAGESDQIKKLEDENKQYDEQLKKINELTDKFTTLGTVKQQWLTETLGDLNLEGEAYDKALKGLTEYYSQKDFLAKGPMTNQQLEKAAGLDGTTSYADNTKTERDDRAGIDATAKAVDDNSQELTKQKEIMRDNSYTDSDGGGTVIGDQEAYDNAKAKVQELQEAESGLIDKQYELTTASVQASADRIAESKANEELSEKYWDQVSAMADTTEGYNQLAEAYNTNLGLIKELTDASGENSDSGKYSKEQMDEMAGALERYRDTIPGLSDALNAYHDQGVSAFGGLKDYMGQAAQEMAQQNGRMYATMHKDDQDYYQKFLKLNSDKKGQEYSLTDEMFIQYGVRAEGFNTYGEYEKALHAAKEKGKLKDTEQSVNKQILKNADGANKNKQIMDADGKNTANSAKAKSSIWAQLTNSGISFADKWGLAWRSVVDAVTNFLAGGANVVLDVWNGVIDGIETAINTVIGGINSVTEHIPGATQIGEVSFGRANHVSGTNLSSDYAANLADKYATNDTNFDYGAGGEEITPKTEESPGNIGGNDGPPTTGNGVSNPNESSKGSKRKVENMKFDPDEMHDTNVLLEQQENIVKKLKNDEDQLYGLAKLNNIKQQNDALVNKKQILESQLALLKQFQAAEQSRLAGQGVAFNADGTIANYNQIIQAKVNAANSIADPDAKEAAITATKKFMDDLKDYETLTLKTRIDKEQAIQEVEKTMHELELKQFEYTITVQLDLGSDEHNSIKFLQDVRKEFEDLSDNYSDTIKDLDITFAEIGDLENHINDTLSNTSLTEKQRIEELEKYRDIIEKSVTSAVKLREEIEKLNEDALKKGVDLLNNQYNQFEHIGNELQHIQKMMKLIGEDKNYSQLGAVYATQGKNLQTQLGMMLEAKSALVDYVSKLQEGSDEWEYANDQLNKMEEQINKITEQTLGVFQDEFTNSINSVLDTLDKDLSGGIGMDQMKSDWSDIKTEAEKYLDVQEKIVWTGNMQKKIQDQINDSTNPETRKALQEFMDTELASLKNKDKLSKVETDRAEKLFNITQKQIALEEARNNKTIQRLVRDASGNWSYQYVEDTKKVSDAQNNLSNSMQDLMEFDKKQLIQTQDDMVSLKEKYIKELQNIVKKQQDGEYSSANDFYKALEQAQTKFNDKAKRLGTEGAEAQQWAAESSMAAVLRTYDLNQNGLGVLSADQEAALKQLGDNVGGKWTTIRDLVSGINQGNAEDFKKRFSDVVPGYNNTMYEALKKTWEDTGTSWKAIVGDDTVGLIGFAVKFKTSSSIAIDGIKTSWTSYQAKVAEVKKLTSEDIAGLTTKTLSLKDSIDKAGGSTQTIINKIKAEWGEVSTLVGWYGTLSKKYSGLITDSVNFCKQLDEQIKKQKEAATGVKSPGSNPTAVPKPATPAPKPAAPKPAPAPAPAPPPRPGKGSSVKVKPGRTWYYDSYGTAPWGSTTNYSNRQLYVVNTSGNRYGYAVGSSPSIADALGWLNLSDLQGFRTGGYTGEFGNDGKLAMLHEKELILNKDDTKNILDSVKIVRDYAALIRAMVGGASATPAIENSGIQQSVTINAEFPGVSSSSEIEKAFENIKNRAAQFAKKK